jgi:hypothetical protein
MQKLVLEVTEIEAIVKINNAVASAARSAKEKYDSLKEEQGYEIPVKGSEEAKSDWKTLFSSVYPKISAKKQKDFTDVEKSRYSSLNRAWNSVLIPSEKDKASCIDCYNLNKMLSVLNISYEDVTEITKLVTRTKNTFDPKQPESVVLFDEAVKHAESERKSELDLLIAAKNDELAKLLEEAEKVSEEFAID